MQIKLLFRLLLVILPVSAMAQSTGIAPGSWEYQLLNRLEIKTRSPLLTGSFTKPFSRRFALIALDSILKKDQAKLTAIDISQAKKLLNDPEFSSNTNNSLLSTGGFRNTGNNNYFIINPVVQTLTAREQNSALHPHLFSYGLDSRGTIFHKIGFSFSAVRNNERLPVYLNDWLSRYNAVPGAGNFDRKPGRKVNYWDVRGSVQTSLTKHLSLQVGYDRNFIGYGYRSLFLSDNSFNTAFAKINARVWKINLQSLYMQLSPQDGIVNNAGSKKYLRINTVDITAAKWLNISFFDAVVLGRKGAFDLNYIIPFTFLRAMEQQSGSPDNALFGISLKANLASKIQLYGSMLLDEFKVSEIKANSGWWANKYGYQLGAKYVDAFNIKNLDIQVESNRVRPFTYTHYDSVSNYSHFNQPLAHPLGANFQEYIAIAKYQPIRRLNIQLKLVYYRQGLDSLGYRSGNNILVNYGNRSRDYGWKVGSGNEAKCLYVSALATYEILQNWFIDVSAARRNFKTQLTGENNTSLISLGLRININRREFDY